MWGRKREREMERARGRHTHTETPRHDHPLLSSPSLSSRRELSPAIPSHSFFFLLLSRKEKIPPLFLLSPALSLFISSPRLLSSILRWEFSLSRDVSNFRREKRREQKKRRISGKREREGEREREERKKRISPPLTHTCTCGREGKERKRGRRETKEREEEEKKERRKER